MRGVVCGCLLAILTGCGERDSSSGSGSKAGKGAAPAAARARKQAVDPRAVAEREARALLTRWLEAQQRLDFAAYAALYEPRTFRGVKRTAKGKVVELDFAGWKADRQRMFKKKFEVAAEPLGVETWLDRGSKLKGGISIVRFTQRWKSGTYADHGVKVLHLWHRGPGDLLVVYEDLLNSEPGWQRVASDVQVADLPPPANQAEALALWRKLAPTGADYHQKLASIPDDPKVRGPMALALMVGGELECKKTVEYDECGMERVEWADFDLTATFDDPCLRRRLALWAMPELEASDVGRLGDELIAMLAMPAPEVELPEAALAAIERGPELLRLRAYRAAIAAGLEEKIDVAGLSEEGLIAAARDIGVDAAALALDRARHLEVLAGLLDEDRSLALDTRRAVFEMLAEVQHPAVAEGLRRLAGGGDSCALSMEAALALERRGDGSFLPRRWPHGEEEAARRALCMSMHDEDPVRARALLASFVGPEGVTVSRVEKSDWDHLEDAGPDDAAEPDAGPEVVTSLDEIEELVRETIEFENADPEWDRREVSFARTKDGGLRLQSFDFYRFSGCGC